MNARTATRLIPALAALVLCCGCMAGLVDSGYATQPLARAEHVDLAWAKPGADLAAARKVIIAVPDIAGLSDAPIDGMRPAALAYVYQQILAEELCPGLDKVYVVRPIDQPLVYMAKREALRKKIEALRPDHPELKSSAERADIAVIETKLVTIAPGANWVRWLVSCGAGMSTVQIDGRLRLLGGGAPVVEWRDRHGCWLPGSSVDVIYTDFTKLAARTAHLLTALREGGKP